MKSNFDQVQKIPVGTVCSSISDTYKGNAGQVVLVNTSDVLEGKVLNHQFVANKNLKGQFKKTFCIEDILYSEIRPQNKRFAFVDFNPSDYIASTKLMVLRADHQKILPRYLYYFLSSSRIIEELQILAETRSGTFPQITFSELSNIIISVPPLDIQQNIIDIVKCIDNKIELNQKINENLERQAQAIFRFWFIDYAPFNGVLPSSWTISTLGETTEMGAGGDKPETISPIKTVDCPYPVYSNGLSDNGLYGFTNRPKIYDESVTVSARGTIGFVCLRHIPYVPIVRLVTLIPDTTLFSAKYLYLYLKQLHISGTGTTQQQLTVPDFKKTEITIPHKGLMEHFTRIVTPLFEKMWANEEESKKLTTIRDTLLPKLMSGEIDLQEV